MWLYIRDMLWYVKRLQNFECHGNGTSYSYMMDDDDDECEQWTTEVTHPVNKGRNYTGKICTSVV